MRSKAGWPTFSVGQLIADEALVINDGYRAKNSELGDAGLPFARAKNVNRGLLLDDADILEEKSVAQAGAKISQPDDVVFTSKGSVGRFAFVRRDTPRCVYSPQLCFWRILDQSVLCPRFLFFWMQGEQCRRQFNALKGQTDMADYISLRDQRTIQLSLPALEEQARIALVLGALDDKIGSNRRLAEFLEKTAAAVFRARFVDFVGVEEVDESKIGSIPRGWEVLPVSEAIEVNPPVPLRKGVTAPFIGMAALGRWAVRPSTIGERPYVGGSKFEPGDTLMARITGCIEHGKGAFVDFLDGPASGSTEFLVFRAKPPLTPEAMFLLSRDDRVRSHAIANMTGSSGRQRVPVTAFDDLEIAVPPDLETWQEDAAFLRVVFEQTRTLWGESQTLEGIRDSLLPKLISGEIRVPDTADSDEALASVSGAAA